MSILPFSTPYGGSNPNPTYSDVVQDQIRQRLPGLSNLSTGASTSQQANPFRDRIQLPQPAPAPTRPNPRQEAVRRVMTPAPAGGSRAVAKGPSGAPGLTDGRPPANARAFENAAPQSRLLRPYAGGGGPNGQAFNWDWFKGLIGGLDPSSESLMGLKDQLAQQGVNVLTNASGISGKIKLPNGQIIDVLRGAGVGGKEWQWLDGPAGGAGGGAPGMLGTLLGGPLGGGQSNQTQNLLQYLLGNLQNGGSGQPFGS
jgi:hypothetical protein